MSNCNTCLHRDRDCVIDPPESVVCAQYRPTLIKTANDQAWLENIKTATQIPPTRGTTAGELIRMHVESENPDHYRNKSVEPIDAMRSWAGDVGFAAYCRLSAIKYLARLGDKDAPIIEAKKAQVYLRWLVETLEGKELSK